MSRHTSLRCHASPLARIFGLRSLPALASARGYRRRSSTSGTDRMFGVVACQTAAQIFRAKSLRFKAMAKAACNDIATPAMQIGPSSPDFV